MSEPTDKRDDGIEKARQAVREIRAEREHEARWDWLLEPPEVPGCLLIIGAGFLLLGLVYIAAWVMR